MNDIPLPCKDEIKTVGYVMIQFLLLLQIFLKTISIFVKRKGSLGPIKPTNIGKFTLIKDIQRKFTIKLTIVTKSIKTIWKITSKLFC